MKNTLITLGSLATLAMSANAQSVDVGQFVLLNPTRLGITTTNNSGPGISGTADVSSLFVNTTGDELVAGTVTVEFSNVWTAANGAAFVAGVATGNNNEFLFSLNTSLVQTDGFRLVDANILHGHGAVLVANTFDNFTERAGNTYTFTGTNGPLNVVSTPTANTYQIDNPDLGAADNNGSINWTSRDITSSNVTFASSGLNANNNYFSALSALTFTQVPEPSSTALLGLGALGLLARRKR